MSLQKGYLNWFLTPRLIPLILLSRPATTVQAILKTNIYIFAFYLSHPLRISYFVVVVMLKSALHISRNIGTIKYEFYIICNRQCCPYLGLQDDCHFGIIISSRLKIERNGVTAGSSTFIYVLSEIH